MSKTEEHIPFMTSVGGHVLIHDGKTGNPLPDDWTGICEESRDTSALWLIGRSQGERSYRRLRATDIESARAEVELIESMRKTLIKPADQAEWEGRVCALAERELRMSTSDAQAYLEAHTDLLGERWEQGAEPEDALQALLQASLSSAPRDRG